MPTVILYRPVGPKELKLIEASGWREFPPRLPEQPIFYPVLNEEYAIQIARDWNVRASGAGYVTRFAVDAEFLKRYRRKPWDRQSIVSFGSQRKSWPSSIGTSWDGLR